MLGSFLLRPATGNVIPGSNRSPGSPHRTALATKESSWQKVCGVCQTQVFSDINIVKNKLFIDLSLCKNGCCDEGNDSFFFLNATHPRLIRALTTDVSGAKFTKNKNDQWSSAARVSASKCTNPWYMTHRVLQFTIREPRQVCLNCAGLWLWVVVWGFRTVQIPLAGRHWYFRA